MARKLNAVRDKPNILLINDQPHSIEAMRTILADEYNVQTAGEAGVALRITARHSLDLVISEVKLQRCSAVELLLNIRELDTFVPIIIVTAYGFMETALRELKLGALDYFVKPIDAGELMTSVRHALTQNKYHIELSSWLSSCYHEYGRLEDNDKSVR